MTWHENVDWLMIGSLAANIILAIVVIIQVSVYRNEINSRLRPWISRDSRKDSPRIDRPRPGVTGPDNPDGLLEPPLLVIRINNYGSLPALHIQTSYWLNQETSERNTFQRLDENSEFALSPNEWAVSRIVLNHEQFVAATTHILYYGYRVDYSDVNGKTGFYELVGCFDRDQDSLIRVNIL